MPWTAEDAKGFTDKADTPEKQSVWAQVANGALKRCLERSDNRKECESSAIRQANAAVARIGKAHSMDMMITKAEKMSDGRVRWRARANSGEVDSFGERCDISLFQDFAENYWKVQERLTRGEVLPDGMEIPHLDLSHYSFRLPKGKRSMARVGWPISVWTSGKAFMVQGYFDDTPAGRMAAKSVRESEQGKIRVSIGFYPDWGNVGMEDGVLVYRGGRGLAYFDHLALTAHPVDSLAMIELCAEEAKAMSDNVLTAKDDALAVLGDDGAELVEQLEEARAKSEVPEGAVVKAAEEEDVQEEEVETEEDEEVEDDELGEALMSTIHEAVSVKTKSVGGQDLVAGDFLVVEDKSDPRTWHLPVKVKGKLDKGLMEAAWNALHEEGYSGPDATAKLKSLYAGAGMKPPSVKADMDYVASMLQKAIVEIGKALDTRFSPLEESIETLQRQVDALVATDTEKVKAALDGDGDWLSQTIKNSVQRQSAVEEEPSAGGSIMGAFFPKPE